MQCALQLRVTYCKSIKLFHRCADGSSLTEITDNGICSNQEKVNTPTDQLESASSHSEVVQDEGAISVVVSKHTPTTVFKSSKCFVILERETQTSSRDWRHDQHL